MVNRQNALLALLGLVLLGFGVMQWHGSGLPLPASGTTRAAAAGQGPRGQEVPWIHLDRVKMRDRPLLPLGATRNIFNFSVTPPPAMSNGAGDGEGGGPHTPTPTAAPDTPTPPTPPPPLPLKYLGLVERKGEPKIAVLLSEQKEILHGREGDLLGGRYRVSKIGIESVDVQDVTTGHIQRLPLRGN